MANPLSASSKLGCPGFISMRRSATVTISAPDAVSASRVSSSSLYFPVPTISRERQLLPARTKGSLTPNMVAPLAAGVAWSATTDEGYDLQMIPVRQGRFGPRAPRHDVLVALDRHARRLDAEVQNQRGHGAPVG